jgi:GNAT superfamily N-acetyltransferase
MPSDDDVIIRRATPADEEALGRYGGALMRQHHAFDPERFITVDNPEKGYGRFLVSQLDDDDDMIVLVAEKDGVVVGYLYGGLEPMSWKELRAACGYLHDVYVDDSVRGHGVGDRLMREGFTWLVSRGAPRVVMVRAAGNAAAARLAARLGFRETMVELTCEAGALTTR